MTTTIYTPNNLPMGWRWHSINGVEVTFYDTKRNEVGRVKCVSADKKAWHAKAVLRTAPAKHGNMMLMGSYSEDTLGNFESKNEAIAALIARHIQHKLEGNP